MSDETFATTAEREAAHAFEARAPVRLIEGDQPGRPPADGLGLCLSGGGYRAMLFHLGSLWRLHDADLLRRMDRISSVSGGSITAGVLGLRWTGVYPADRGGGDPAAFESLVVEPLRRLASKTIDRSSTMLGLLPGVRAAERVAAAYRKRLFGQATLQDLPGPGQGPLFIINATNLQSGVLWRFSRPYMADYTVGLVPKPAVQLARAVSASSAFPPLLSPLVLKLSLSDYAPDRGARPINAERRSRIVLTDGGVYDNMGLETVFKNVRTVLVSDAGGGGGLWDQRAGANWLRQFWRVFWVQRYQVGRLRRRQLIEAFKSQSHDIHHREGAYWGIGSEIDHFGLPDALPAPTASTDRLRDTPTRLRAMPDRLQQQLINWGYAVCDASIRKHLDPTLERPAGFPYPDAGVG